MEAAGRWWKAKGRERAQLVVALVEEQARTQSTTRDRCLNSICIYEGKRIPGLHPLAYFKASDYAEPDSYERLYWNIPRSLCQTVQAKIAGKNKPKIQFVVTEGDWSTKRKAHKLDRFVEGQMHSRQGMHSDIWSLYQAFVLDALRLPGGGVLKVLDDYDAEKVRVERVFPWELFADPDDARHGNPRTIVHRYACDADKLREDYSGHDEDIDAAKEATDDGADYRDMTRAVKMIWVYDAYHLGSKGKPGVHSICIDGAELYEEEWTDDAVPFVRLQWAPETMGWGSQSLIEEVEPINDEVNYTLERMQEGERKLSNGLILVPKGSVADEDMESNDIAKIVEVDSTVAGWQPIVVNPQGYSESTLEWLRLQTTKQYEIPGVSQMSATSRKEPGVTAAVAMRTIADIETERFSVFYSRFEDCVVDVARHMVRAVRRIAQEKGDVITRWPGQSFMREYRWSEIDLNEDLYSIRPYAVSGIKNTPADRLQLAYDLAGQGSIGPDALARVVQYLDTPGEFERVNKQREWVGKMIETWLDATEEDAESGKFVYHPPIKFMVLEDALLQVAEEYFSALMDDIPEFNASFFLMWLEQCDKLLQERAMQQANIQGAAQGGAPPVLPPMGAGPGAAPPPVLQ